MLFLSLHICRSLPKIFCARDYMVRKEMLDEEFNGVLIVHGHLWCVNGVMFAILESPYCWNPSIKFLIKRIYGLEEDAVWRIRRWLFTAGPSLMCEWDDFCYFWVAIMSEAFLNFFCPREYIVWKEMVFEEFKDSYLVNGHHWWVKGVILAISESPFCRKLFI